AVWRRRELLSKPPQKLSEEELAILNDETEAEVKMGFLEGPFHTEQEVTERLGTEEWSPSQRFLLLQGEDKKPRVIDNLRDSGVNASFGSTSLLQMHDIDFVMSLAMFISRVWKDQEKVRVQLRDGTVLEGHWNAASRDLVTSVYVDDYPTFELLPLAANASNVFSRLLTALGWVHATEGKKAVDFSSQWVALGAAFDFSKLHQGELTVSNKEGRLERIATMAQKLPAGDCDVKQVATSLHGLLNFASGFVLGSALKPISRAYSRMNARKGFVFIDNNSALATLVKRSSQSEAMFRLVAVISSMDAVFPFGAWYERVPSKSNPSDLPSRGEAGLLCQRFGAENDGEFE
ncbi:unnamed protein product, partial [Symbiodinium necroappetens]